MALLPPNPFAGFSIASALGRNQQTERFLVRRTNGPQARPGAPPEFVLESLLDPQRVRDIEARLSTLNVQPSWFVPYPVEIYLNAPQPFWILNILPGETLHQRITRSGPIPWAEAAPLVNAILDRLEASERAGFVHGGLDPHQIWLSPRSPEILGFITASQFPMPNRPGTRSGIRGLPASQALIAAENRGVSLILHSILLGREGPASPLRRSLPALAKELLTVAAAPTRESTIQELQSLLRKGPDSQSSELTVTIDPASLTLTSSSSRASPNDLIGRQIGQIQILSKLGSGGMGTVYKGRHLMLDKHFAVKVLRSTHDASPETSARFQREAQIAARLEHPNIVSTIDFGVQDSFLYLVMRLIEGEGLDRKIEREAPLPLLDSLRIGLQIARGLDHAHKQQLIHRDIKPANILLSQTGEVLITDFGLARSVQDEDAMLTATGAILGTPAYMSPEQCEGLKDIDGRTDVYSLGLILYELIGGRKAARGETPLQMIRNRLEQDLQPLIQFQPQVPHEVSSLIASLLVRDPARRLWPTGELVTRLESLIRSFEAAPPPLAPPPTSPALISAPRSGLPRRMARATGSMPARASGSIPAPTTRHRLSGLKQDEAQRLSDSIASMLDAGQTAAAEEALQECPPELDGRWRDELRARWEKIVSIKEALGRRQESDGARSTDAKDLQILARQLVELCPQDPEANEALERHSEALAFRDRLLDEARRARKDGAFEEARAFLSEALARLPKDSDLDAEQRELEQAESKHREALEQARIREQNEDYVGALEQLQVAQTLCPTSPELRSRINALDELAAKKQRRRARRRTAVLFGLPIGLLLIAHVTANYTLRGLAGAGLAAIDREDYSSSEGLLRQGRLWLLLASPQVKERFREFQERHEVMSALNRAPTIALSEALQQLEELSPQDPALRERLEIARAKLKSDIAQSKALKEAMDAPLPERSAALEAYIKTASGEYVDQARSEIQRLADWRQRSEETARKAEAEHLWDLALQSWNEARALGVGEASAAIERIQNHKQWIAGIHGQFHAAIKARRLDEARALLAQLAERGEDTRQLKEVLNPLIPK